MLSVRLSASNVCVEDLMQFKLWFATLQRTGLTCLLLLFGLFCQPLLAASDRPMPGVGSAATQIALGLLVVLLLMFFLAWLAKRLRLVPGAMASGGAIKVLAVLQLGNREKILLVQVGDQQLVLGVTSHQITCLHQLEEPIKSTAEQTSAPFAQLLKQWKSRTTDHVQPTNKAPESNKNDAGKTD